MKTLFDLGFRDTEEQPKANDMSKEERLRRQAVKAAQLIGYNTRDVGTICFSLSQSGE